MTSWHLLVTADDSPESLTAATSAARLARELHAQVRILVVVEDDHAGPHPADDAALARESRRREAANLLAYLHRRICDLGVPEDQVDVAQATGEPFREILDHARTWPADVIVMATSDQRGVRSNYIGSVTQQVIEFAQCPVLVVPGGSS